MIELYDSDYDSYTYPLDVKGLPEWLKLSGDISSLEGLDEFTNLEEAVSLELVNFSGSSPVKSVYIADNTNLKSLTLTGSRSEKDIKRGELKYAPLNFFMSEHQMLHDFMSF